MPSLTTLLATTSTLLALTKAAIFTLTASLPGSILDGQPINAGGAAFYIGGTPGTYCPTIVEPDCPNVTGTVFAGMSALWVEVPGGQQTYVTQEGKFTFTQAHSIYIPTGSYLYGWTATNVTSEDGDEYTLINFTAPDSTEGGLHACPYTPPYSNETIYQIYAQTPAFNQTDCLELDGFIEDDQENNDFGAWQYI